MRDHRAERPFNGTKKIYMGVLKGPVGCVILVSGKLVGAPSVQAATSPTIVSLAFDDGTTSQYALAWQRALAPHRMAATFSCPAAGPGLAPAT
jgi:hypothetical protein